MRPLRDVMERRGPADLLPPGFADDGGTVVAPDGGPAAGLLSPAMFEGPGRRAIGDESSPSTAVLAGRRYPVRWMGSSFTLDGVHADGVHGWHRAYDPWPTLRINRAAFFVLEAGATLHLVARREDGSHATAGAGHGVHLVLPPGGRPGPFVCRRGMAQTGGALWALGPDLRPVPRDRVPHADAIERAAGMRLAGPLRESVPRTWSGTDRVLSRAIGILADEGYDVEMDGPSVVSVVSQDGSMSFGVNSDRRVHIPRLDGLWYVGVDARITSDARDLARLLVHTAERIEIAAEGFDAIVDIVRQVVAGRGTVEPDPGDLRIDIRTNRPAHVISLSVGPGGWWRLGRTTALSPMLRWTRHDTWQDAVEELSSLVTA